MKKLLYFLIPLLFAACGSTDTTQKSQNTQQPSQSDSPNNTSDQTDSQKTLYSCSATRQNEESFIDIFTVNQHEDIAWSVSKYAPLSVKQIEEAFNKARAQERTVDKPMVLPPQQIWDGYSSSEKILYLINKERCDRGLRPYEGIDPKIENVASAYALFLKNNPDLYARTPHEADGRTPWQRMAQDAGVTIKQNADFFRYGENIASFAVGSSGNSYPFVHESEAKSVYGWMYEDKNEGFGHREFILAKGLVENAGFDQSEGLIGVGVAERTYRDGGTLLAGEDHRPRRFRSKEQLGQ